MKADKAPPILVLALLALMLLAGVTRPVQAAPTPAGVTYETYVVKQGDWLAKIARQFCTTWQEIYVMNRGTIGPYPNRLVPGTVLTVPNRCGAGPDAPDGSGVYDRGPSEHAQGSVAGNVYSVAPGDTVYSISRRFGVAQQALLQANGLPDPNRIYAGQKLVIPGLIDGKPPTPMPKPTVTPTPKPTVTPEVTPKPTTTTTPSPPGAFVTITSPAPGSILPATFAVTGTGGGLFEGNVVVIARSSSALLAEQATVLQGPDVGTGGSGTWSVQLTVNVAPGTPGLIVATSPGTSASASVPVVFGAPPGTPPVMKDFAPGECRVQGLPNAPIYAYPGGSQTGQFVTGGIYEAMRGTIVDGQYWYMINLDPGAGTAPSWVPITSLAAASAGCTW